MFYFIFLSLFTKYPSVINFPEFFGKFIDYL